MNIDSDDNNGTPRNCSSDGEIDDNVYNCPPFANIWECPMDIRLLDRIRRLNCAYCPGPARGPIAFFKHINHTKALHHVLKMPNQNIHPCKGNIPQQKKNPV